MNWTTEFPTQEGFYWIRNYARVWSKSEMTARPTLIEIYRPLGANFLHIYYLGIGREEGLDSVVSAEWYGPIEPPE